MARLEAAERVPQEIKYVLAFPKFSLSPLILIRSFGLLRFPFVGVFVTVRTSFTAFKPLTQ